MIKKTVSDPLMRTILGFIITGLLAFSSSQLHSLSKTQAVIMAKMDTAHGIIKAHEETLKDHMVRIKVLEVANK